MKKQVINRLKVYQVENKNQFEIVVQYADYTQDNFFQSYNSLCAIVSYENGKKYLTLFEDYDYSRTTSKHLRIFLSGHNISLNKDQLRKIYLNGKTEL